jgi:hypothetical protein
MKPTQLNPFVIASEAKQSRIPKVGLDCHVATLLAMTMMHVVGAVWIATLLRSSQ